MKILTEVMVKIKERVIMVKVIMMMKNNLKGLGFTKPF